jgi:hypothetical protein
MRMSEKLYIKTRHPREKNVFVDGELEKVKKREEQPNVYELEDGTIISVYLDLDSVSYPIDPKTGDYFRDESGEKVHSIDYHVRVVVSRPLKK